MYHAIVQGHLKVSSKEHKFRETIYSKLYFTCIALLLNMLSEHLRYLPPACSCEALRRSATVLQFGTFLSDWIARLWKYCLIHSRLRTVCLSAFLFFLLSLSLSYDISFVQQDKWAKVRHLDGNYGCGDELEVCVNGPAKTRCLCAKQKKGHLY